VRASDTVIPVSRRNASSNVAVPRQLTSCLLELADDHTRTDAALPLVGDDPAEDDLEQRRLAAPVASDDRDALTERDRLGERTEHEPTPARHHVAEVGDDGAAALRLAEGQA
jgi:hypothetical protein